MCFVYVCGGFLFAKESASLNLVDVKQVGHSRLWMIFCVFYTGFHILTKMKNKMEKTEFQERCLYCPNRNKNSIFNIPLFG
jgi:hypothetical protein